jgi:exosome complex component RRP4
MNYVLIYIYIYLFSISFFKLRNGSLVVVPPALVQRCKTHFHTLPCGVDLTLGLNGYIWVSKHTTRTAEEVVPDTIYSSENEVINLTVILFFYFVVF